MKDLIAFQNLDDLWVAYGNTVGGNVVAAWCGNDIQYSTSNVDDIAAELREIETGKTQGGDLGAANAHSWSANREWVFIEGLFDEEEKVLMTHAQTRDALMKYRAFLDRDFRGSETSPEPYEVEFIADGAEAFR